MHEFHRIVELLGQLNPG